MPEVLEFQTHKERASPKHESWLRRQGVQIAAQLPEDEADAVAILEFAMEVVRDFLSRSRRT